MAGRPSNQQGTTWRVSVKALGMLLFSVNLGGCAGMGDMPGLFAADSSTSTSSAALATVSGTNSDGSPATDNGQTDLQKATVYWGKEYAKAPTKLENALSYAKNLRAIGDKRQALAVLQQASEYHGANKELAAEYGKVALELDQTTVAKQMLAIADDPAAPDWKIISARGTAEAKLGNYKEAIPLYERALSLKPGHPPIMNNLALALTMSGEAGKAEGLLRQASGADASNAKVRQNLALVLGLQGKYDEATKVGSETMAADGAKSNTQMIRQMVKLEPKVMPQGVIAAPSVQVANTPGQPAIAGLKPAVTVDNSQATSSGWSPKVATAAPVQSSQPAAAASGMAPTVIQADGVGFKPATSK